MGKEILSANQATLLKVFSQQAFIQDFYLTGGTALAVFYLNHRYSEDLDFFTQKEDLDPQSITIFLESLKSKLSISEIDFQKSMNRNIFFITLNGEVVKTEFTFFPFEKLESGQREGNIQVDSLLDIAVNKLFTIYQNPRARDFIDLYFIINQESYRLDNLIEKARLKFDWPIDPINLGTQLVKVKDVKDYPRMIKPIEKTDLVEFFEKEARGLGEKILV